MRLLIDHIAGALGTILVVARDGRVCALDFQDSEARMLRSLTVRYENLDLERQSNPFGFSDRILAYLEGDLFALDAIPVETGGTDFQQRVWSALRRVAPGRTVTYSQLASAA